MIKDQITFNDLPQVIAELRDEVSGMKALLLNLQNRPTQQRENRHRPVTPEQVAEYTNIPLATIYQKLANREIPGSKPGKRWVKNRPLFGLKARAKIGQNRFWGLFLQRSTV